MIQWYPGHIAKLERQLTDLLKMVDVVVEVLDARMPQASVNPRLEGKIRNKPVLLVLNKADLADPRENRRWLARLQAEEGNTVLLYEAKSGQQKKMLIDAVVRLGESKMQALEAKGLKRRPVRLLVAGMPNVGKSSIINSVVGRKKATTGHKAGVTRQPQWVRIHPAVELLDSPGIIPPRLDSEETGALLATASSIGEAAFQDEEIAAFLLQRIEALYPGHLSSYYGLSASATPVDLLQVAQCRSLVKPGGEFDALRAAQSVLKDFRQGRFGRLTLEWANTEGEGA